MFYQWIDGSLAYYLKLKLGDEHEGSCAYYQPWDNEERNLFFDSCYNKVHAQVFCEMPPSKDPKIKDKPINTELNHGKYECL